MKNLEENATPDHDNMPLFQSGGGGGGYGASVSKPMDRKSANEGAQNEKSTQSKP